MKGKMKVTFRMMRHCLEDPDTAGGRRNDHRSPRSFKMVPGTSRQLTNLAVWVGAHLQIHLLDVSRVLDTELSAALAHNVRNWPI